MNRTKYIGLSLLALLCCVVVKAQTVATKCEYWIDQQIDNRATLTMTAGQVTAQLNVSALPVGLHSITMRAGTNDGRWGSPLVKNFIVPQAGSMQENTLSRYEYWVDGNLGNRVSGTISAGDVVAADLNMASLPAGLHSLSFRVIDDNNNVSSVLVKYFIVPMPGSTQVNNLSTYEYWIDGNLDNRVSGTISAGGVVVTDLDMSTLSEGLHSLSYRALDDHGNVSPVLMMHFFVPGDPSGALGGDKIVAYEYWFNDNPRKRVEVEPTPVLTINEAQLVVEGVEPATVPANYTFNVETKQVVYAIDVNFGIQVFNDLGVGSVAATQTIAGHQLFVDTQMQTLANEQASTLAAPTGCKVQGYRFDCKVGEKLYWLMDLAEGTTVDFYDGAGTKIDPSAIGTETVGEKQARTITATTNVVYALVYGATATEGQNTIKVIEPVTITINNAQRKYGAENPTFTYTSEQQGYILGTPTFTTEADETSPVGEYAITLNSESITNTIVTVNNGTLTITKADGYISYEVASVEKTYGDAAFINPLTVVGDGTVAYSTSDASVVTVDSNTGEVTIVGAGEAVITATVTDADEGNFAYAVATATYAIGVSTAAMNVVATNYTGTYDAAAHGITVTVNAPEGAEVKYGTEEGTYDLTANPTYTNAGTYTTYYQVTKPNYTTVTGSAVVTIDQAAGVISFAQASISKAFGDEAFTNPLTNNGDGTVTYASDNETVATVDAATGKVTITGAGEANITATVVDGTNFTYATKTASFNVGVGNAAMDIAVTGYSGTYDGAAHGITVTVNVPEGAVVRYGTEDGTYDLETSPKFTDAGSYTVYYQVTKQNYNTVTNSAVVSISKAVGSISYEVTDVEKHDTDTPFTNELTVTGDGTVAYTTDNVNVATIDAETGEVTITGIGTATITATVADGTNYEYTTKTARYTLTVTADPATGINVVGLDDDDPSGTWYTLGGLKLDKKPSKPGIYVRNGRKVVVRRK